MPPAADPPGAGPAHPWLAPSASVVAKVLRARAVAALLVPPGDVRAFRNALLRLYEDTELRAPLVANARRRVSVPCDLEALTGEMFSTLQPGLNRQ